MYFIFDIGGTNIRLAISVNGTTFTTPIILPTPKRFSDGIKTIIQTAHTLSKGKKIEAAAGGIAGPLDQKKTHLIQSPNIPGWINKPLATKLSRAFHIPVYLENDAAIVGLGEATAGAGKHSNIVAYVTISTGVNGVRIVDKKIDVSAFGFEIGHQIVAATEKTERHWEHRLGEKISGKAMQRKYGVNPREFTNKKTWDDIALWTARGLVNTAVYWSPDIIVLGGSMMNTPGIPLDRVRHYYKKLLYIFPRQPRIVKSKLGNVGGLYGALALLRQKNRKK